MTKTAVVFSGRNGLDFMELRGGVMRIPDVTRRLREAQSILDAMDLSRVDLLSVVSADDEMFFRNIQLKSLCSAIVQVGLYDRYLKTQRRPDFMLGNTNGDSAMMVASGLITFKDLVEKSQAVSALRPAAPAAPQPLAVVPQQIAHDRVIQLPTAATLVAPMHSSMPLLSGLNLTEYNALETKTAAEGGALSYEPMRIASMDLRKLVTILHEELGIHRFINIGPASALRGSDYRMVGTGDIESLDSIDLDPMLVWFWRGVRPQASALAQ